MKVAAIMPTYNQRDYIQDAVDSVLPQVDWFVLVDDGSTIPARPAYVLQHTNKPMFEARHSTNLGTAAAINTGFDQVTPDIDLVTWVSSDNVHQMDWREKLEAAFADDVGVVYSAYHHEQLGRTIHTPYNPDRLIRDVNCFFGPSFMIRREVWEKAGPHRGKISHDYDHWLRVEEACQELGLRIVDIPDDLCFYRCHDKRATITRHHEFDAREWQEEAIKRRAEQS